MVRQLRPHQEHALRLLRQSLGSAGPGAEEWRAVVGYEGLYEVSSHGGVRSVPRTLIRKSRWGEHPKHWPGKVLSPTVDRGRFAYGRLQVKLCRGTKRDQSTRLVHSLVAEAFLGPRPEGAEIAHGDGNAANNRLENLRYATPAENSSDKFRHGTALSGESAPWAKLTAADAKQIRLLKGREKGYALAERFNISPAQVSRIQSGRRWGGDND